jgi:hypothetical protein
VFVRFLFKNALAMIGLAVFLYVFFFVPLGERTAFQHARRIAGTDEAQELGREAGEAAGRLGEHLQDEIQTHVIEDAGTPDAGPMAEALD